MTRIRRRKVPTTTCMLAWPFGWRRIWGCIEAHSSGRSQIQKRRPGGGWYVAFLGIRVVGTRDDPNFIYPFFPFPFGWKKKHEVVVGELYNRPLGERRDWNAFEYQRSRLW